MSMIQPGAQSPEKGRPLAVWEVHENRERASLVSRVIADFDQMIELHAGIPFHSPEDRELEDEKVRAEAELVNRAVDARWTQWVVWRGPERAKERAIDVLAATNTWKINQAEAEGPDMVVNTDAHGVKSTAARFEVERPMFDHENYVYGQRILDGVKGEAKIVKQNNGLDIVQFTYEAPYRPMFSHAEAYAQLTKTQIARLKGDREEMPHLGILGEQMTIMSDSSGMERPSAVYGKIVGPIRGEYDDDIHQMGESGNPDINYVQHTPDVHDIEDITALVKRGQPILLPR